MELSYSRFLAVGTEAQQFSVTPVTRTKNALPQEMAKRGLRMDRRPLGKSSRWPAALLVALRKLSVAAVETLLQEADSGNLELLMSWLNVAETFYILAKPVSPAVADEFLARLPSLPIRIVLPDQDAIMAAARPQRVSKEAKHETDGALRR